MHPSPLRLLVVLFFSVVVAAPVTMAQSEAESATGAIELQMEQKDRHREIEEGTKVSIKYTTDPRVFPDLTLDEVLDTSVVLSGDTVGIRYVDRIIVPNAQRKKAGLNLLLISLGLMVAMVGLSIFVAASVFSSSAIVVAATVLLIILSIPGSVAPMAIITGIVLLAISSTSYKLWTTWKPTLRRKKSRP